MKQNIRSTFFQTVSLRDTLKKRKKKKEKKIMTEFATGEQLSGLAGEIRSSVTSDQYDLGGYTEQRAKDLMHATFRF